MGFGDMEKADKMKVVLAVTVLVIAMAVIGWYTLGGGGGSSEQASKAPPAPDVVTPGSKEKPASNRRAVPGADQ